ncbi:chemotaxis protein CheR [Oceanidesulfovibrio indonesiensis]|uniref:protein-glutamate O-methyltransferase n=1 Tax=Oceanidesulfovibrio indonesiensis TaxID=54767 RepID=A0A7M3MGP2_9BACT|nr:protein-glutamate O-methyltransferase [Oceanidesulfovibrio indonesiensis]TVM18419.1 chemotaxis protein CheR [Oceanidesulfovibrio indonesiensis]
MADTKNQNSKDERGKTAPGKSPSRPASMSPKDFAKFSQFIYAEVGIKMPPSKKTMLEARLQKRLRYLNLKDYHTYCEYLFSSEGMERELPHLIDVVTTNTTDFFREPKHFEFLSDNVLPLLDSRLNRRRPLAVWSAGCSIGMEPYTLAMVLSEYAAKNSGFSFSILATDISTQALEKAVNAVYEEERVLPVPGPLKTRYLLRSKDRSRRLVRIVPELRKAVRFRRLNFMEDFSFRNPLDIIFCRNVIIYFDRPTQEVLFHKFCRCIAPGGFLFIGHSESLSGMDLPLKQVAPTIYQRI